MGVCVYAHMPWNEAGVCHCVLDAIATILRGHSVSGGVIHCTILVPQSLGHPEDLTERCKLPCHTSLSYQYRTPSVLRLSILIPPSRAHS